MPAWLEKALQALKTWWNEPSEQPPQAAYSLPVEAGRELPPLSEYESRRPEIAGSSETVEGIFYIYNGQLIPDYYSECLLSDKKNPRREVLYHFHFFPDYMVRKFDNLYFGEKSIPRGRTHHDMLFIDACYAQDVALIRQIKELYRLPDTFTISTNNQYCCSVCCATVQNTYQTWPELLVVAGNAGSGD